jgi:hypothetical protein
MASKRKINLKDYDMTTTLGTGNSISHLKVRLEE